MNVGTFDYWEKLKESIKNMKIFYYGFFHLNIDVIFLNVKQIFNYHFILDVRLVTIFFFFLYIKVMLTHKLFSIKMITRRIKLTWY